MDIKDTSMGTLLSAKVHLLDGGTVWADALPSSPFENNCFAFWRKGNLCIIPMHQIKSITMGFVKE